MGGSAKHHAAESSCAANKCFGFRCADKPIRRVAGISARFGAGSDCVLPDVAAQSIPAFNQGWGAYAIIGEGAGGRSSLLRLLLALSREKRITNNGRKTPT